ncbi:uncharacterized protein LOC100680350 isoform X1 [Nasonia vitripennis]|uniref:EF-hand calcium-binding domain-containing protein 14 n=1 Tax=Nasonia vitripennis TaxID=7425 RepID=A0A7M7H3U6_NASVI|nr:uncharacterized protein LOC100680350 isoform X1 [Nasonia vitripennis]XP_003424772.1 uncharacterized protein LOC100680350 isoform X1 [Nasonia vitripennis]XP_008204770.1 uncharacterized protein LOC100680350 isoform X1 [Nasonia vitripennis]XP_008204783.1 uncharacterized protein LOC100680350 isoform X1 [Nasonia vitripennis]XP_031787408.1 uncharacterized protein LOC100680350 isoform X1 [Nasonia vitripennis]XP_031787409.1 uncharacterized protein LOC100680350 isoform X1 [Nasonia vitripennis]XP_03
MDSVAVTVPLRPPAKKMKKRKELDALAPPHAVSRRSSGKRSSQELLSDSSDERSEYWNVSTTRGGTRKARSREAGRGACPGLLRACSVFLGGTIVLVTAILIWLFIDVRQQLTVLRAELDQVIAGSEGVPDALQTCHTLEKNFTTNIKHITDEIQKLNRSINSFSGQVSSLQQELQQVQVSLKSAPELTSVPDTVKVLQNSIGLLELDIHELQINYKMVKDSTFSLQQFQEQQRESLSKIQNTLTGLSNITQPTQSVPSNETLVETKKLWDAVAELSKNLTHINETLTTNITWAQEDISKDHKTVVSLQDMAQNASAQILTLQQECIKRKDQEILQNLLQSLSSRVDKLSSTKMNQERPQQIEQMYSVSKNSTDTLMSSLINSQAAAGSPNEQVPAQKKLDNVESTTTASSQASVSQVAMSASSSTPAKQLSLH